MIGHYLLTLTPAQEDRVLTQTMRPGEWSAQTYGGPCLLGTVHPEPRGECLGEFGKHLGIKGAGLHSYGCGNSVASTYDDLCDRFGAPRVNAAIRNRILSNRARRELRGVRDSSDVAAERETA